jgi:predicted AAA+ superfamily ATPase
MLKLKSVIDLTLESDIPSVYHTEFKTIYKLKKLLYIIATSLPYQANITELSRNIETTSRNSTLQYLDYLDKGKLIDLKTSAKGKNILVKPDKIYLDNTNLMYAIGNTNLIDGNVRETFFFNQLRSNHSVNTSKQSDFLVDELYTFEIGGKGKKQKQILNIENSYIAADNIEIGFQNKIPLWLFGLLY